MILSGTSATAAALANRSTPFSALHLAGPFRVNSASPLFSPLLLAAPLIKEGEEPPAEPRTALTVREVFALDPLALAVMIADPAALARRDAASSLAPIAWGWRSSGAATLILRRWDANDETAAALIGRYYEEMRKGESSTVAYETARAAVRGTPAGRAPAAWAGWLLLR